jgi:hypothetical protein
MSIMHCSLLSFGCAVGFSPPANQGTLTALRALKIAQRRLRPEVRAKLLTVSSARTDPTFTPEAWRFVFFDPATSGNCRVVTVAAKTSSEHPDTVEAFNSCRGETVSTAHVIPQTKLLIDSSKALELIRAHSKLKGARAAEFRLVQPKSGQEPLWTVQFYAENGAPLAKFGVGAKSGKLDLSTAGEK